MPRITHNHAAVAANHSLYQNELLNESHITLKEIASNTKNINLNVDTVDVSVDALEVLQAANNTTTSSIDTRLDNSIGAVNNSGNLGEGSSQLRTVSLGYDRTGGKARSILVDSGGITQVHDSVVEATSELILAKNSEVESSLNSLISANHTDLVALEASLTSMESKIDTLDTVQDNALAKLTEISTNTSNINVNVGDVEVNTNDLEVLQASTNSKLDSILSKNGEIETSADALIAANHTDLVALEASLTSMEGKQDSLISANHTDLVALEASLTSMEGKQDSLISANHTDLVALEASLTSMEGKQDDIKTLIGTTNSNLSSIDSGITDLDTLLGDIQTDNNSKSDHLSGNLDAILAKNGEIETSANAIQAAVEGTLTVASHAVTNAGTFAVQAACSGTVTANLSATDNAVLDAIAADGDAIQTKLDTLETTADAILAKNTQIENLITSTNARIALVDAVLDASLVKHTNNETLITAMSAKLPASLGSKADGSSISTCRSSTQGAYDMTGRTTIGTASTTTNVLVDSAGHLQVDVLSGGIATDVSTLSTHAKQDTIIGHLDGVEGKLDHLSDNIDTLDAVQDNALTKLGEIETSADAILAKNTEIETTADAILAKNTEIETSMNSLISANHADMVALESKLIEIAPRAAVAAVYSSASLADAGVSTVIDTDDYSFMTIAAKQDSADLPIEVQYSIDNSKWFKIRSKYLTFAASDGGSWADVLLERPMRYVKFVNNSGSTITNLHMNYQLSN